MQSALETLRTAARQSAWTYHATGPASSEPAAWSCLALAVHGEQQLARAAADWLADIQAEDGSLGVTATQQRPAWPTSLAILAWHYLDANNSSPRYRGPLERATHWALHSRGKAAPPQPEIGHDSMLVGWSWAEDTHSWLEPTALFAIALKSTEFAGHERTREAVRLIVDRLLPAGGCNYGNTIVLGQTLLSHIQPTGLAMLALAGEANNDLRIEMSLELLENSLGPESPVASLCYGLLALRAHDRLPAGASGWLESAAERTSSCYKRALIALAAAPTLEWLAPGASSLEVART